VYEFGYGVQADGYHGGASFGHNEARNGYSTIGEYRVELPDGRTQVNKTLAVAWPRGLKAIRNPKAKVALDSTQMSCKNTPLPLETPPTGDALSILLQ
jgi:hypothetical protein